MSAEVPSAQHCKPARRWKLPARLTRPPLEVTYALLITVVAWASLSPAATGRLTQILVAVGPTSPVLAILLGYLCVLYLRILSTCHQVHFLAVQGDLAHAEDVAEVAAVSGLLGTIIAMVQAGTQGNLDINGFLQSLLSTLIGSGTAALSILIASTLRRLMLRRREACLEPREQQP